MLKHHRRKIAASLTATLACTVLAGCGLKDPDANNNELGATTSNTPTATAPAAPNPAAVKTAPGATVTNTDARDLAHAYTSLWCNYTTGNYQANSRRLEKLSTNNALLIEKQAAVEAEQTPTTNTTTTCQLVAVTKRLDTSNKNQWVIVTRWNTQTPGTYTGEPLYHVTYATFAVKHNRLLVSTWNTQN